MSQDVDKEMFWIVQDEFANCFSERSDAKKRHIGNYVLFTKFLAPLRRMEQIYTDTSKEII